MKKLLAICSVFFTVFAFTSCGSDRNDSSDGSMNGRTSNEEYASNYDRTDKDDDRTDRDDRMDDSGRDDSVKDYVSGAADGVGEAGKDIIDGAGNAGKDVIDGVEGAADDLIDGVDGHDNNRD